MFHLFAGAAGLTLVRIYIRNEVISYDLYKKIAYCFLDLGTSLCKGLASGRQHLLILSMIVHHVLRQLVAAMNTQVILVVEQVSTQFPKYCPFYLL